MIKRNTFLALLFAAISHIGMGQITQLELASGGKKTDFTSFSLRPLTEKGRFSIGTLAFFQRYHQQDSQMLDETGVHSTLYWNINGAISVGTGLYYNSVAGFFKRLSVLYTLQSPQFMLTAIPTMAYAEETGHMNGELFMLMQFTQPLKRDWKLLLSAQTLASWDKFSEHSRSFQQVRVGVAIQATQFGIAVDVDQYGATPVTRTSPGLFLRKIFLNN